MAYLRNEEIIFTYIYGLMLIAAVLYYLIKLWKKEREIVINL